MKNNSKNVAMYCVVFGLSIVFSLVMLEGVLVLKNQSMKNYDIEMWKYAKQIKFESDNPVLGHEHKKNASAVLQSVEIRTNEWGLRGPSVPTQKPKRTILFLGSSITFGWGVKENETVSAKTEEFLKRDGEDVLVLNAGIGNYNSQRYVELFFEKLKALNPTDIVVNYFLRDAEVLERGGGNWFLRNSQLAVTLWNVWQKSFGATKNGTLEDHYRGVYAATAPGRLKMESSLLRLSDYAKQKGIRLFLAMTPDVHNLKNYPFEYIHKDVEQIAKRLGYTYVDLLPAMRGLTPEEVWSMPGDPHPNALGHLKMAEALYPVLKQGSGEIRTLASTTN